MVNVVEFMGLNTMMTISLVVLWGTAVIAILQSQGVFPVEFSEAFYLPIACGAITMGSYTIVDLADTTASAGTAAALLLGFGGLMTGLAISEAKG